MWVVMYTGVLAFRSVLMFTGGAPKFLPLIFSFFFFLHFVFGEHACPRVIELNQQFIHVF